MKSLLLTFLVLLNLNSFAGEVDGFTISDAPGKFASVYLVSGGQGVSSFEVQRVYRKVGTFKVSAGYSEVPASTYERFGWRGPSYVLVVTHNQKEHALNKVMSDDLLSFEDPTYSIQSDRVHPTAENVKYSRRKAILLRRVNSQSGFAF